MNASRLVITGGLVLAALASAAHAQETFQTPEAAAAAIVDAAKADDRTAIEKILGPDAAVVLDSGDPVDDANARKWFVDRAAEKIDIQPEEDGWAIVAVGTSAWPLAVPLRKTDAGWIFDVEEGKQELLDRRVGANELVAISVARAFVDAQHEYATEDPDGNGVHEYAGRVLSTEGKRDGLYWPTAEGETASPFGPLVADATSHGYTPGAGVPYEGYRYRILTKQGSHAPGGAKSYEKDGRLTEGVALVAWPASYGTSGVKTFIVNQLGVVFEKDLGPETATVAAAMDAYDPDRTWSPSRD
jgi:hypothetical protein